MALQALIGERIRSLREAKGLTQEELAAMARSDAATLSRIETGKQNLTAETLALFLMALNTTPKEFFGSKAFGKPLTANPDDPDAINSEFFSLEEVGGGSRVHFRSGKHRASFDFPGLDPKKVAEAILTLRRGLRQAEVTPKIGESPEIGSAEEMPTMKALMSAAIAESFLSLVRGNVAVNPSDVWRYIVSPAFCDPQNHPSSSYGKDLAQSFKRTGGWALERVLVAHYSDFLGRHGIELTKMNAKQALADMGLEGRIPLDKIDLFILARQGNSAAPLGVIHIKSSLAERRTDDVPASELILRQGYLSLFVTLDAKDTPSPNPVNKGEYGPALVYDSQTGRSKGSEKRKDIEEKGLFSAVFSWNARTIESPQRTKSGCRIIRIDFANPDDKFSRFILEAKERLLMRTGKKR